MADHDSVRAVLEDIFVKRSSMPEAPDEPRRIRRLHGLGILVVLVVPALFGYYQVISVLRAGRFPENHGPIRSVSLVEQTPATELHAAATRPILRVAIAPVVSPERSLEKYQPFVEYLARNAGREPMMLNRPTYAEIDELIRLQRTDLAFVCTYSFVRGEREFGLTAVAVPVIRERVTYHSVVLVPTRSRATSLTDLRARRFASADLLSSTGWVFPATSLLQRGEDPNAFFSRHIVAGGHDRAVELVEAGQADGAAVDSLVYEQMLNERPGLERAVRVVVRSPPFGMPPLVVHPSMDATLRHALERILRDMHKDESGRRVLAAIGIDRFVTPTPSLHDTVRAMAAAYERPHP